MDPMIRRALRDLRRALGRVRGALRMAREVALVPTPAGRAHLSPRAFVASLVAAARAHLGRPIPVLADLPRAARPTGARPLVLHLIDSLVLGGSQKLVFDIVRGLGAEWDMHILTSAATRDVRFGDMPIEVARDPAALATALARRRPAVVHLHFWGRTPWLDQALAALVAAHPGVPVLENVNSPGRAWVHPAVRHWAYVSEWLRATQPIATAPSSIVYPGVDTDAYRPTGPLPRAETVGLVYRLEDDKLAPDTIEVLVALARRRPSARIVLVGSGRNFRHYVARTRAAGVRERFHFAGLVAYDELPAWYDRFSLFCAPVHAESYGVVVPYALAKDIPVCGYRVGALPEILGPAVAGAVLVDTPGDLAALAAELLADYPRRVALGRGGRARVLERFSLAAMLAAYRELYEGLAV